MEAEEQQFLQQFNERLGPSKASDTDEMFEMLMGKQIEDMPSPIKQSKSFSAVQSAISSPTSQIHSVPSTASSIGEGKKGPTTSENPKDFFLRLANKGLSSEPALNSRPGSASRVSQTGWDRMMQKNKK